MPIVEETLLRPNSDPIEGAIVAVRLAISSNSSLNTLYSSQGTFVFSAMTTSDGSGHWDLDLPPNDSFSPPGSVYEIFVEDPERDSYPTRRTIQVPDESGPHTAGDLEVASELDPVQLVSGPAGADAEAIGTADSPITNANAARPPGSGIKFWFVNMDAGTQPSNAEPQDLIVRMDQAE